jgi:hypothetical protein
MNITPPVLRVDSWLGYAEFIATLIVARLVADLIIDVWRGVRTRGRKGLPWKTRRDFDDDLKRRRTPHEG